jgi:hypothetical protein
MMRRIGAGDELEERKSHCSWFLFLLLLRNEGRSEEAEGGKVW